MDTRLLAIAVRNKAGTAEEGEREGKGREGKNKVKIVGGDGGVRVNE